MFEKDAEEIMRQNGCRENVKPLYYIKKLQVEYEQFYCKKTRKLITLENWDFGYCPFCGEEVKE